MTETFDSLSAAPKNLLNGSVNNATGHANKLRNRHCAKPSLGPKPPSRKDESLKGKKICHVNVLCCDLFAMMKKLTFHANTESRMWSKLRAFHLSTDCKFFLSVSINLFMF